MEPTVHRTDSVELDRAAYLAPLNAPAISLPNGGELVVKNANLLRQSADVIIVPTNSAFAFSGAAGATIYAIEQARRLNSGHSAGSYELLFPRLAIPDPLFLRPDEIVLDLKVRPRVAPVGCAVVSESLDALNLQLEQPWKRIIAAVIRHQSDMQTGSGLCAAIRASVIQSLTEIDRLALTTAAMVPFGTGFGGIPMARSAEAIGGALSDYLRLHPKSGLRQITIVTDDGPQYVALQQALRDSV